MNTQLSVNLRLYVREAKSAIYLIVVAGGCREVARQLKLGTTVQPENFTAVTIFLCDIVGFTPLAAAMKPIQVSSSHCQHRI